MKNCSRSSLRQHRRRGMTLAELLVVLAILSILALTAVTAVEPLVDQARFERTQRSLQAIRQALVTATPPAGDSGMQFSGYVLHVGAFPTSIADLVKQPVGVATSSLQGIDTDFDGTVDASLSAGWAGPYIEIPVGAAAYVDGWGNEFVAATSGMPATLTIGSLGADGLAGGSTGYAEDLGMSIEPAEYRGSISFRLYQLDAMGNRQDPTLTGTEKLGVVIAGVNADAASDQPGVIQRVLMPIAASALPAFETAMSSMTAGQMVCRALQWDDANSNDLIDSGESIVRRSVVQYITLAPGSLRKVLLDLQP